MIAALGRFVEALRREGVGASPAEAVDAARAAEVVDLGDRARFKAALAATLAKDRRERETFDRVFEKFFVPPVIGAGKKRGEERRQETPKTDAQAAHGPSPPELVARAATAIRVDAPKDPLRSESPSSHAAGAGRRSFVCAGPHGTSGPCGATSRVR